MRADGRNGLIVNENGRIPQADKVFGQYEALFYAFYNRGLVIDETDMLAALSHCYELLEISDYLGCTSLISKPIEVALLNHGQGLFRAIQNSPSAWIEMSYRIQSESMFQECMIHLVGNWKTFKENQKVSDNLRKVSGIRALIENYYAVLINQCKNLELAVLSEYPGRMKTPADDPPIKREAYAKDILIWMALSFFRHWVTQRLVIGKGRHALDCGYELYSLLYKGGDAYMDRSVVNQFHTKFPMTKKALNVLDNHLLEIKECIKDIVEQHKILQSNCQLDTHRFPVNYLTCIDFQRSDCPWLHNDAKSRTTSTKPDYKAGGNDIAKQNLETARMRREREFSAGNVDDEEGESTGSDVRLEPLGKRARLT